jgi:nitrous oxidase accessory protein NosD
VRNLVADVSDLAVVFEKVGAFGKKLDGWCGMEKRAAILLSLFLLLSCFYHGSLGYVGLTAPNAFSVHNVSTGLNYTSIQEAIDAAETLDGNTILVDAGTYYTSLVVDKSLKIISSERNGAVIDGGGKSSVVYVDAGDVSVEGFVVKGGVSFDHSDNSTLRENTVTGVGEYYAVYAGYSDNITIDQNAIGPNSCSGVLITNSLDFKVSDNYVHDNEGYGINANASLNGLIMGNNVYRNSLIDGIGLSRGCRNVTVTRNNLSGNMRGVDVIDPDCEDNIFYDNNFIGNGEQASVVSANRWDNGFEGNYWSDFAGVDENHDGISDAPYILSENNTDNHPLIGVFSVFETVLGLDVDVVSNSSISTFDYFVSNGTIRMQVSNSTGTQTFGFCRVRIAHGLLSELYNITVDGAEPLFLNYTLYDDGYSRWVYFAYSHSQREVLIQGRPPPPIVVLVSPENTTYTTGDVPLTLVVNELSSWLAYSMDGRGNMTIIGNTTLLGVSNGTHAIVVYARNNFGDTSVSGIVYFSVNATGFGPLLYYVAVTVVVVTVILVSALFYLRRLRRKRGKNR